MATNFGFMPVLEGKRYFISYKSEDTERVGEITRRLNEMGVPMWYDYGIEKGKRWSAEINRNIEECEAFILFATRALFAVEDTWVRKEFRLAMISQKNKYIVWLDDLNPFNNPNDVHLKLRDWYLDLEDLQGLKEYGGSPDLIAWRMVKELNLIYGMPPQPPSPTYLPTPDPGFTPCMDVRVGGKVTFGQYPQGADGEIQPLVWRVLAVENDRALLITDDLIDALFYNEICKDVTWETCTLRKWMNNDFLLAAFSIEEQARIVTVTNQNPNNLAFGTKGGKPTEDRIFALSIEEAGRYFQNDDNRMVAPTPYAKKRGAYISDEFFLNDGRKKCCCWWLRSPGLLSCLASCIYFNGDIHQRGLYVYYYEVAVRPAFWLNLS